MTSSLNALDIRKRLGREEWAAPQPFGPDGWRFFHKRFDGSIIVTVADHDGIDWVHASVAFADKMPSYDAMRQMHAAVFPHGWAYEVFAPPQHHVNIHAFARHLWGRLDNEPAIPNFGVHGTI